MKATTAEKRAAQAGREITVARASAWTGSKESCFRAGVDASKMWACSVYNPAVRAIYEPSNFYRTLAELVEDQIEREDFYAGR